MSFEPRNESLKMDFALAVSGGKLDIVKNILAAHPDAAAWDDVMGGTALRKAVAHGSPDLETVRFLVEQGSDIDAQDKDGLTPLMFAAMHGESGVIQLLLEKDAKTEPTDKAGRTAAQIAYDCGHTETALALVAHDQHKREMAEAKRLKDLHDEAAQAHSGLDHAVYVNKPLVMRP